MAHNGGQCKEIPRVGGRKGDGDDICYPVAFVELCFGRVVSAADIPFT